MSNLQVDRDFVDSLIKNLNHYCLEAGTLRFEKKKKISLNPQKVLELSRSDQNELLRSANWAFKKAQNIIIENRLRIEEKNSKVNFSPPYNFDYLRALLTDYADLVTWCVLRHDISHVRNFFVSFRPHTPLMQQNWSATQEVLNKLNKNEDQIALATDLTSFVHVGDILCLDTKNNSYKIVEIKEGQVNKAIGEVLQSGSMEEFGSKADELIAKSSRPEKTRKQMIRNIRQIEKAAKTDHYYHSKQKSRIDLQYEMPVRTIAQDRGEEHWSPLVRKMAQQTESGEAVSAIVDDCLMIAYGKFVLTRGAKIQFINQISEHFDLDLTPPEVMNLPVFSVGARLATPGIAPQSLNLLEAGRDIQSKILSGEHFLLTYLHIPALKDFLKTHDINFLVRNLKEGEHQYTEPLLRILFGQNKIPEIRTKQGDQEYRAAIGSGMWARILFNFLGPVELVNHANYELSSE